LNLVKEELENRFGAVLIDPDKYRPSYYYHAFSLPDIPVVCSTERRNLRLMKWGLIPSWTRNIEDAREIRLKTFNARAESVNEKRSFVNSFRSKRCIVPVKGFFEWQHAGKEKIPWYIYGSDNDILVLAGLFDDWTDSATGESIGTFSVITTTANGMMSVIHNSARRMPAILGKDEAEAWLNPSATHVELSELLRPAPEEALTAHTISQLINDRNSDRNRPELIAPYVRRQDNLLF
jgi:putative SOS response-associated peptidase YedK